MKNLETTMELTIKVVKAGNTDNIQLFRGNECIGLQDLTEHEKETLIELVQQPEIGGE